MASSLSRSKRFRTARSKRRLQVLPSAPSQGGNSVLAGAEVAAEVLTLTFEKPVILTGSLTGILTDVAEAEVSASQIGPTQIEVTYAGSVAAATVVVLPDRINAIRTATGGFAVSPTFPVTV